MEKSIGLITMEKMDNREANSVGSSRIRARWLLNYWDEAEEFLIGKKYDVLIFQKVYWDNMMENFDGIKILDICDPDWLEGKPVMKFVDLADAVVTSSEALATFIKKMRPNALVKHIPDRVYLPEHKPIKTKHEGNIKNAVWFGYSGNTHYLFKTFEELINKGIHLTFVSDKPFVAPLGYSNLKFSNVPYSYPGIHAELVKHDVVLLPEATDDERGKFKSNNKTVQAWALGMPVVKVPEDLDRFMDPKEREKEGAEKLQFIKDNYDVKLSVDEYKELINTIKERKAK